MSAMNNFKSFFQRADKSDAMEMSGMDREQDPRDASMSSSFEREIASIQTSSGDTEVQAAVEATDGNGQSATTNKSLFDVLKECIPKGSNSVLERTIHDRVHDPTGPNYRLFHNEENLEFLSLEDMWAYLDKLKPSEHRTLIIQDIDYAWCERLVFSVSRFDQSSLPCGTHNRLCPGNALAAPCTV
jgi:hypothetical protein